jgi:hypothetical protein
MDNATFDGSWETLLKHARVTKVRQVRRRLALPRRTGRTYGYTIMEEDPSMIDSTESLVSTDGINSMNGTIDIVSDMLHQNTK